MCNFIGKSVVLQFTDDLDDGIGAGSDFNGLKIVFPPVVPKRRVVIESLVRKVHLKSGIDFFPLFIVLQRSQDRRKLGKETGYVASRGTAQNEKFLPEGNPAGNEKIARQAVKQPEQKTRPALDGTPAQGNPFTQLVHRSLFRSTT